MDKALCPVCGELAGIRQDGKFRSHRRVSWRPGHGTRCDGGGQPVPAGAGKPVVTPVVTYANLTDKQILHNRIRRLDRNSKEELFRWLANELGTETPDVTNRLCACGCGQAVTSTRPEARYATGRCRVRAHRAKETSS